MYAQQTVIDQLTMSLNQAIAKINALEKKLDTLEKLYNDHTHSVPYLCLDEFNRFLITRYTATLAPTKK